METARPIAVGPAERTVAAGPATPGMVREQAFAADDRWVGFVRTEPGVWSGWHHHGDTDTYFYVLKGTIELEFGPGGHERLRIDAGDYAYVPPRGDPPRRDDTRRAGRSGPRADRIGCTGRQR